MSSWRVRLPRPSEYTCDDDDYTCKATYNNSACPSYGCKGRSVPPSQRATTARADGRSLLLAGTVHQRNSPCACRHVWVCSPRHAPAVGYCDNKTGQCASYPKCPADYGCVSECGLGPARMASGLAPSSTASEQ
jgi:hypothetical protein